MDLYKTETTLRKLRPNFHLEISLQIIRYLGTWSPEKSQTYRFAYLIFSAAIFTFMLGIFLIEGVVKLIKDRGNLAMIAAGAPVMMTDAAHAYKFFVVVLNQRRIQDLLNIMDSAMFSKNNVRHERIVSWYAWNGIFHHITYQSFGLLAVLCWGCIPIADMLTGKNKHLPMILWYPYDVAKSPAFEITWSHQAIAIILSCVHNVAMDAFITGLMNSASCQFELLKWNISAIGKDEKNQPKFVKESSSKLDLKLEEINVPDETYKDLCNCIRHNVAIFNFVAEIQDMFSTVISLQLFVNCFIICLTTFYISQLTTIVPAELIGNISYTCCMTYQIFIYCWHGNEIYLQNEKFSFAVYNADWWKFNERCKSALHIVMLRTSRPLILTAGFLITLSLSAFMAIIKMSYSLFTLLRSSTEKI